jgi:hypothetical protein
MATEIYNGQEVIFDDFKSYLGNPLLKRPGVTVQWTPQLAMEYARCARDPIYFIETYMKIINVDEGLIPFKLRDYQKEITLSLHNNRNTIIATARQAGKSTIMTGYILWYILFNEHKVVALLANKGDTAQEIFSKVQLAYQHLPKWLQQGVIVWNKTALELENGCRAFSAATSSDAVRGYSINLLVLDEAAHIEDWESFSTSVLPTITSGKTSKIVMISTPKGLNHFYTTWHNARMKKNNYNPIEVPWQRVPGRDEAWRQATLADLNFDLDKFAQEFEVQFLGSSGTLIAGWKLKELVSQMPIYSKEGLRKYKDPVKKHIYAIAVDTSEGKGLDHSAFQVIDVTTMPFEQVCVFNSNVIPPPEYGQLVFQVAKTYNEAMILIEYESMGPEVADTLWSDLGYENVLMTESAGSRGKRISSKSGTSVDKGVKMTVTVKATGCSILKLLIEQNKLIINDEATIDELKTFSRHLKTFRAEEGKHDDMVMALVVFAWLSNQDYFKDLTDVNTMAKLRERTEEQIDIELTPFGFFDNGIEEVYDIEIANDGWHTSREEYPNF